MGSKFVPVDLQLIEGGEFLGDAERSFAEVQDAVIKHARKYSSNAVIKGSLTLTVEVLEKDGAYAVTTAITKKLPGRPKKHTSAMADELQAGGFGLFAQSTGTNTDNPRQRRFQEEFEDEEDEEE
jgi:hypothetical protein